GFGSDCTSGGALRALASTKGRAKAGAKAGAGGCVLLDAGNLRAMAIGCSILGAGGGGDTSVGLLASLQAVEEFGPVRVVDLDELDDDALVMPCGGIGAPLIWIEKIDRGDEIPRIIPIVERIHGKPVAALMSAEIGGSNGLSPVVWCARSGRPLVDADGMGRAFPEVPQVTMEVAGVSPSPAVMTDERGNVIIFEGIDGHWMERMELAAPRDPVASLVETLDATVLLEGKIVDVERRISGGFVRGSATIEGLGSQAGRILRLEIQNENLIALEDGEVRATVPDIITVCDTQTATAIHTERLRYGQRVTVIAFACDPIWRTPAGLELAGPRAFGYDLDYVPVEAIWRGGTSAPA